MRHGEVELLALPGHFGEQGAAPCTCLALDQEGGGRAVRGIAEVPENSLFLGLTSLSGRFRRFRHAARKWSRGVCGSCSVATADSLAPCFRPVRAITAWRPGVPDMVAA